MYPPQVVQDRRVFVPKVLKLYLNQFPENTPERF